MNELLRTARVTMLQSAATWAVRTSLTAGFQKATGHAPPTARDRDVPFGRILAWAALTAAAVSAADVVVDRLVLRQAAQE